MPYILFTAICLIWGSSFILMKKANAVFSPVGVGAGRVIGGAFVLLLCWLWERSRTPLSKRDWLPLAFVVVVGYGWPYIIQPHLVTLHGSAFIGLTVSFVPLLTVLVSIPMLAAYPSRRQLAGVVGGLVCMAALFADGLQREVPLGDLLLAGSVPLCYALTNCLIRGRLAHVGSLPLSTVTLVLSSALLVPLAFAMPHDPVSAAVAESPRFLPALFSLAFLGMAGTGLGTYLFNKLVQEHGPLFAGMVTYLVPVGAIGWGWLDGEHVTALQLTALAGIFIMVGVVQYGAATKPATATAPGPAECEPAA